MGARENGLVKLLQNNTTRGSHTSNKSYMENYVNNYGSDVVRRYVWAHVYNSPLYVLWNDLFYSLDLNNLNLIKITERGSTRHEDRKNGMKYDTTDS